MDPIPRSYEVDSEKVVIGLVYAGGTIASLPNSEGARTGGHDLDLLGQLTNRDPAILDGLEVSATSRAYSGLSENLTRENQEKIAEHVIAMLDTDLTSVVITHGTDTLEHTAQFLENAFLERLIENGQRIIITGANEDSTHPDTDAWSNLSEAFRAAKSPDTLDGVHIAFGGKLIRGGKAVKTLHQANESAGYTSDESEQYEKSVEERLATIDSLVQALDKKFEGTIPDSAGVLEYPVNMISESHDSLLLYVQENSVKAIVFKLYHSGTADTEHPTASVLRLVEVLRDQYGVVSFGATETGEPTDLRKYETSVKLRSAGLVPLYDMLGEVAAHKLRKLPTMNAQEMIVYALSNAAGEIDEASILIDDIAELYNLYAY